MKVKFYYSSRDEPGRQYPCDNKVAVDKIEHLRGRGVDAEAVDVAGMEDVFRPYIMALTGPPATARAVFGMKGGMEADFGRSTPALLVFGDPNNRYPTDAYPRQDQQRGGLVGVERALDDLITSVEPQPAAQAVGGMDDDEEETH